MVFETEKYSFLEASCCKVEVVKGGAGLFFAGFFLTSPTLNLAEVFCSKNMVASCFEENSLSN